MSNFNIGDRVKYLGYPTRYGVVRNNTRQQCYGSKATWIDVEWDGKPYRPTGYGLLKSNLKLVKDESVTPKVGDTIRATRGETVISATVDHIVSSSYVTGGNDLCVRLDGEPDQFFWVNDGGGFTVEIIKPKVVLPTKVGAVIRYADKKNYVRVTGNEYGSWYSQATGTTNDDWQFTDAIKLGKLEILFEGVDIP